MDSFHFLSWIFFDVQTPPCLKHMRLYMSAWSSCVVLVELAFLAVAREKILLSCLSYSPMYRRITQKQNRPTSFRVLARNICHKVTEFSIIRLLSHFYYKDCI